MTELTKDEITDLMLCEMAEHDLVGVVFKWEQLKTRLGYTKFIWDKDTESFCVGSIVLSESFFNGLQDKWAMVDTLYHELAHAVAFNKFGCSDHGEQWKQVARSLGAQPSAKCGNDVKVDFTKTGHKYIAQCPACDYSFGFSRMGRLWKNNLYQCPICDADQSVTLLVTQSY